MSYVIKLDVGIRYPFKFPKDIISTRFSEFHLRPHLTVIDCLKTYDEFYHYYLEVICSDGVVRFSISKRIIESGIQITITTRYTIIRIKEIGGMSQYFKHSTKELIYPYINKLRASHNKIIKVSQYLQLNCSIINNMLVFKYKRIKYRVHIYAWKYIRTLPLVAGKISLESDRIFDKIDNIKDWWELLVSDFNNYKFNKVVRRKPLKKRYKIWWEKTVSKGNNLIPRPPFGEFYRRLLK